MLSEIAHPLPFKPLKYQQIETQVRELIETLPIGSKLPAERYLAASYKCNFLTVRRALKPLVTDGTIVRQVGSGTFVAQHRKKLSTTSNIKRNRIGVLVYRHDDSYAYRVLRALSQAAAESNTLLSSTWIGDFGTDGLAQAKVLADEGCLAIVLPWFPHDRIEEIRLFVRQCPLPVSLPIIIPGLEGHCFEQEQIFGSHAIAATKAVIEYYQKLGHQRIAFLGPATPGDLILQRKLSAYACHAARENFPNLCGLVEKNAGDMDRLADSWKSFRGDLSIVSYDDEHALRLITAMHKIGLNAPSDYRIIGFNDTDASRYSDPPLSTVCQNFLYIGTQLLKAALALANGQICQSTEIQPTRLVIRATCGGGDKVDDAFCSQMPQLDIVFERAVSRSVKIGSFS